MDRHRLLDTTKCTECSQVRAIEDLAFCKLCHQESEATELSDSYYCVRHCFESDCDHALDCLKDNHKSCWEAHLPSPRSKRYKDHIKHSAADDMYIQLILYSEVDKDRQRELHLRDRTREWFRVTLARTTVSGIKPTLQVSDRFRTLCQSTNSSQPPSFVSFVGDTGVGKSTLVRAMIMVGAIEAWRARRKSIGTAPHIDLDFLIDRQSWGPVTRSSNIDLSNQPTSVGVHLYKDPNDISVRYDESDIDAVSNVPVLFADCEGFRGGTSLTSAEHVARETVQHEFGRLPTRQRGLSTGSTQDVFEGMDPSIIIKDCDITAPDFESTGKESAELFYARFLYAFSDVVIFVTNEDQKLNDDMRRLLEWSATAMAKSIVQKSAKTLIIVVNGPKRHFSEWYDPGVLKEKLFKDFGPFWHHSVELKEFVAEHNRSTELRSEMIHDNQSLFEKLFQDVKMCYIPLKEFAPPNKLYAQYLQLRNMMLEGTRAGQRVRASSFDLYNVPAMWRLLDKAFDHFANSRAPFDFYTAARRDNPTPVSVPGHIANMLRLLGTEQTELERFIDLVACCMIVYTWRTYDLGREPKEIFEKEIYAKCKQAVTIYEQNIQQCEAKMFNDGPCILKCFEHRDEHCDNKSQRLPGKFYTSGIKSFASLVFVVDDIQKAYISLYHDVFANATGDFHADPSTINKLLDTRLTVFSKLRIQRTGTKEYLSFKESSQSLALPVSTKTCLACLQFAPDHVLICGHILCADCVKDFGEPFESRRYCYNLRSCVLCGNAEIAIVRNQKIQLDTRFGGARMMTLDGGGIRGIIELAILEKIMAHVGLPVPLRELFDLIVGTSTGGIIALALTMADPTLSVTDLKTMFEELAKKTFQYDRLSDFDFLNILPHGTMASVFTLLKWIKSRYDSTKLQSALQEVFEPERPIFGDCSLEHGGRTTRVAVTSTTGGEPCAFSNYSRYHFLPNSATNRERAQLDDLVIDNELIRADNPAHGFKIWQAGMATAAAPLFFPPFEYTEPNSRVPFKRTFVDGALHSNSPVSFALEEKDRIWPKQRSTMAIDFLITIGTGNQSQDDFTLPKIIDSAGSGDVAKFFRNTVDSERAWGKFRGSTKHDQSIHYRLNISLESRVQLDHWKKMRELMNLVDSLYEDSDHQDSLREQIEVVANRLTASLFFYEPSTLIPTKHGREYIEGRIWCRLDTPSEAFRCLISRVQGFYFHRSAYQNENSIEINFNFSTGKSFQRNQPFRNIQAHILQSPQPFELPYSFEYKGDGNEKLSLLVGLTPPEGAGVNGHPTPRIRISGFPTTFNEMKESLKCRGVE